MTTISYSVWYHSRELQGPVLGSVRRYVSVLFTNASTSVSNLARQHSSLQLTPLVVASGSSGGLAEGLKNLQVFQSRRRIPWVYLGRSRERSLPSWKCLEVPFAPHGRS